MESDWISPNERKRLQLMNECGLTFDQANKVLKKIKEWKN